MSQMGSKLKIHKNSPNLIWFYAFHVHAYHIC